MIFLLNQRAMLEVVVTETSLRGGRGSGRRGYTQRVNDVREPEATHGPVRPHLALDQGTVTVLREHRKRMLDQRLAVGGGFVDLDLVFHRPDGGPLHPERFSREFTRAIAKTDLARIRLHDLLHGGATMALSAGVQPKVI
ncbi:MAG TPA: hypothetical protein VJ644_06540 [Jiangellaceae bacterium]|nr:hypothetical protein [Jiangellaceae bacterium]